MHSECSSSATSMQFVHTCDAPWCCRFMALASTLLRNDTAPSQVLQARQEMLALAKVMVHLGDAPPELLSSALLKLAIAYSNMSMSQQALAHCTDAVALAYRIHSAPSKPENDQNTECVENLAVCFLSFLACCTVL